MITVSAIQQMPREQNALLKLDSLGQTWITLQGRGVHLRGLKALKVLGLAEDDPTTKRGFQRWRLTGAGEQLQGMLLAAIKEGTIHDP